MKKYVLWVMVLLLIVGPMPAYAASSDPLDNWTESYFSGSETMYGVAYGNGTFVGVGAHIVTSPDGTTWTPVTTPPGFSYLASVIYGGNQFVAVGWHRNLYTSPDGQTWTSQLTADNNTTLYDVAYGEAGGVPLYVAVGSNGLILTSPNGATWTQQNSGTAYTLDRVTYGNGRYVAVGDGGTLLTSTDGVTWTSVPLNRNNQLYAATYGNGMFAVGGYEEWILTSTDGVNWTERRIVPPVNNGSPFPVLADYYRRAMYSNGTFFFAGTNGKLVSSTDGINWTSHSVGGSFVIWGLTAGNEKYIASGSSERIYQTSSVTNAQTPSITTQPSDHTVDAWSTAPTLSVGAGVQDGGVLTYQWYNNKANSNTTGNPIPTATSATYEAPTNQVGTTYYYVEVTNTNNSVDGAKTATVASQPAKVTVNPAVDAAVPTINTQPVGQTVDAESASPTLSVGATAVDGGTLSYQWYVNETNSTSDGLEILGATNATYDEVPTTDAGTLYYYVVVTNTNNNVPGNKTASVTSQAAMVTVSELTDAEMPTFTLQPSSQTVDVGVTPPVHLEASAEVHDGGTVSYQWYKSDNGFWTLIDNATSSSYEPPTHTPGTTRYYVAATNTNDQVNGQKIVTNTSNEAVITVNSLQDAEIPRIATEPVDQNTVMGTTGVTLSVGAWIKGKGTLSYQWYTNPTNSKKGWESIPNATSETYEVPTIDTGTNYYYVKVTNTDNTVNGSHTSDTYSSRAKVNVQARVSFNSNGGSSIPNQTLDRSALASKPADPTRSNDLFGGWYQNVELTQPFDFNTPITENKTLYAKWTSVSNGGSGNGGGGSSPSAPSGPVVTPPSPSVPQITVTENLATMQLPAGIPGTVSLNDQVKVEIPQGATNQPILVTIEPVKNTPVLFANNNMQSDLISPVFELLKDDPKNFLQDITVTLQYDASRLGAELQPAIFYYNEKDNIWVWLQSILNPEKNLVSAKVNHFTKYAVFAVKASTAPTDDPTTAQPLTDLSGHWAEASVQQLIQLKAISGYPDHTFKPNHSITRAEFVSILNKALSLKATESKTFADTDKHWAADAIGTVAALGIVTGDGTGNFRPNAPITREEMAVIMTRALKLEPSAASSAFKDEASISTWAKDAVSTAVAKGLLSGFEDGTFRAQAQATRAEAATLIVRALQNRP